LCALSLILVAIGLWYWQARRSANAAAGLFHTSGRRGDLTLTVTANGTIQPTRSINIGSELSGTVVQVNVDVNDKIKKGQVLVVLDTSKLKDQISAPGPRRPQPGPRSRNRGDDYGS